MTYEFIKMNGLGNDFVIFDARRSKINFTGRQLEAIANRHTGIGCDQVVIIEPSQQADIFMRIYNIDGGEAEACGNAARCVTWLIAKGLKPANIVIETLSGQIQGKCTTDYEVAVDMGQASFAWDKIPLSGACDTLSLDIHLGPLKKPGAVNVGNPHMVFFAVDLAAINLHELGPQLKHHPLFLEGANINVAQIISPSLIHLKVWERGTGLTQACGTGACATVATAAKKGLVERTCRVIQKGGELTITVEHDDHITMTGPVAENFRGSFSEDLFAGILDKET